MTLARMRGQFDENDREFFALCEECEEREYFDNNGAEWLSFSTMAGVHVCS